MIKIDSHQHFWKFDPVRDSWITDDMEVIQKDFSPVDLQPLLQHSGIGGCVTVQSDQSEEENGFHLSTAEKWDFIKGVVGWVDLQAENVEERLEYYSQFKKMKGFRHVLQGEPQRDFMLRPAFVSGIGLLNKYGFTYDILIFPDQLKYSYELVKTLPDQFFVIDHMAKPNIKDNKIDDWKNDIQQIATCKNVYCKVSGMVTEGSWKTWTKDDFTPYLDVVVSAFGTDRIMFGSDWPVCLVAASYAQILEIVTDYFAAFSQHEQADVFGNTATQFYKLDV
ncbi:amidohydrolase family protein [Segetibacter sp.]|jgi:L-fuconolactonase|uniref:amidohydrolase family protein n=1 Tax=Segetibacter sp. TaxID=2231182 RepID=UPI0026140343|nr:amidohydrolase family protein [Segetibacter sp.]MCW3080295.1 amidohydrolase family protein [Segetibacter sp.]